MTKTFVLWTHGASVIPEETKAFTGVDNGLRLKPTGFGAKIHQNSGTSNWFHFAIPSGSKLCAEPGNAFVTIREFFLRFTINNDAAIKQITVHHNYEQTSHSPRIYDSGEINWTGQDTEYCASISYEGDQEKHWICKGPIVICVRIDFEGDNGEVTFTGAGVRFEGEEP